MPRFLAAALLLAAAPLGAQSDSGYTAQECPPCREWNAPTDPVRLFANVYYVGTRGLSAVLVTSDAGHVLIDAGLPESAPRILASIRALGFRVEDVKLIVNSHAHYDHAGGIAAVARASGAQVAARAAGASVITRGQVGPDDPQAGIALPYPGAPNVRIIDDGDTLRVGPIALVAHATAGHTPGGTSWTWRSCEGSRCLDFVYADSQSPISTDGFLYSRHPSAVQDFERGQATIERLSCDVLVTPHPSASQLFERIAARDKGTADALVDREACRRYAAAGRKMLAERLAKEGAR